MNVKLRKRLLATGKNSLFLDYYPGFLHPDTGKLTRFEFLDLHTFENPKNEIERNHNRQTNALAENVRAMRQLEVQNKRFGFISDEKRNGSFVDYFRKAAAKNVGSNFDNWQMGVRYFISYAGEDFRFSDLTLSFCEEYRDYMLSGPSINRRKKPISVNTAVSYFGKFRAMLKPAFKAQLITTNLREMVDGIKSEETHREHLSLTEFKRLIRTKSANQDYKKAAIFSCLTGLRFSDINALKWGQLRGEEGEYEVQFRQEKTTGAELLPISDQAFQLLGERMDDDNRIFGGLNYNSVRTWLPEWLKGGGITKKITFHCFRHTYATLQLAAGTDIYTVSKMLGHRNVKTTQIYTKVVDEKKREAANRIVVSIEGF
ncbi:site-specific integrase [Mucilaginibacter gynuensis]|uniref:Site-specific integrase n=1 Tax=Mucilaginibacter gynuensis TaxID=1302236 RepID=A0ABP8HID4_9SPHI